MSETNIKTNDGQVSGENENGDAPFTVDPSTLEKFLSTITSSTTSTTSQSEFGDPFKDIDPEKLETALQSELAKKILGENVTAMLDMLTVEEQQNSIRYSIELDHCYTSRTSPSDPAPLDPLPVRCHENDNVDDDDNRNHINSINNAQLLISASSESGPSDNDSDFGPRGGGLCVQRVRTRGGRTRGGRKGLTTRGGTMVGRGGRPNTHQMDIDQVERLNNEMAAAVDAMKKVGGVKTMGGNSGNKRKGDDEDDDYDKSINSSSSSAHEKTQFQKSITKPSEFLDSNELVGKEEISRSFPKLVCDDKNRVGTIVKIEKISSFMSSLT